LPFDFESRDQILGLIQQTNVDGTTQRLIADLEHRKRLRLPFRLEISDFEKIIRWKLRGRYSRQAPSELTRRLAFSIVHFISVLTLTGRSYPERRI